MTDTRLLGRATSPKRVTLEVFNAHGLHGSPTVARVVHARESITMRMFWKPVEACLEGHVTYNDDSFVKVVVRLMSDARILGRVWANATTADQWQFDVETVMKEVGS